MPVPPDRHDPAYSSIRCGAGFSIAGSLEKAVAEAIAQARGRLDGPADLAVVFISAAHVAARAAFEGLAELLGGNPAPVIIGGTVEGVLGGGREQERGPGVVVWLARLPGAVITPMALEYRQTADGGTFTGWPAELDGRWPEGATLLLVADPFSFPVDQLIERLEDDQPGVPLVGGMLSGGSAPGENTLVMNSRTYDCGGVGVLVSGGVRVRPVVSQGCRPIGRPFVITRAEENLIHELGGRPALEQLREIFGTLDESDQRLVRHSLHLGRVASEYQESFEQGDFLVRNVIGADPESGVIAVADMVRVGQTVQFHVRDAQTAHDDLVGLLDRAAAGGSPAGALVFTCNGRGRRLFEEPHHDAAVLQRHFGDLPAAGFFAQGEIGPIGSRNCLHGFTASIALFEQAEDAGRVTTPPDPA